MPSTGAVVKPLPSRTWGVSSCAFLHLATAHRLHSGTLQINVSIKVYKFFRYLQHMEQIVFRGVISSAGSDKYGEKRYAIYIPKSVKEKAGKIAGKEVIVIVILPDDEE
ncbi:hypothetical protein YG5714_1596 [Sulfolobus islandicus Y.G.57.14]|uniref:DUF1905 domain-containing protein n=5 Tax=Saccharolobus TaxID=2100760 RepID=C3NEW7_SACI7|nr:hypothetical protein YG5714_1596 [Sulfolobus islandicus Y.G.57.14]ACP48336.1 hypothetical protein YN1551_1239 [Sulfolobus islandicus Y.N.15.51]